MVREMSGHEGVYVTPKPRYKVLPGASSKTGDKIAAKVAPDGPALSITLQIPDVDWRSADHRESCRLPDLADKGGCVR